MINPSRIEHAYKEFMSDLESYLHDPIIDIDLKFLHESGILDLMDEENEDSEDITQHFDVIHGEDKATLYNEQFILWIVPQMDGPELATLVLIALNKPDKPHLEVAFVAKGAYSHPPHVFQIINYFLFDTMETEAYINLLKKAV